AILFDGGTIADSHIDQNRVHASSPHGSVDVRGGGIDVAVDLTLHDSTVNGNIVEANGTNGGARGGGIYDVAFPGGQDGPPGGPVGLSSSTVTRNVLAGSAGVTRQGGGIFVQGEPVTLTSATVAQNVPDQCIGC